MEMFDTTYPMNALFWWLIWFFVIGFRVEMKMEEITMKRASILEVCRRLESIGFRNAGAYPDSAIGGSYFHVERDTINKDGAPERMKMEMFVTNDFIFEHSADEVADVIVRKWNEELKKKRHEEYETPMMTGERTGFYL